MDNMRLNENGSKKESISENPEPEAKSSGHDG